MRVEEASSGQGGGAGGGGHNTFGIYSMATRMWHGAGLDGWL